MSRVTWKGFDYAHPRLIEKPRTEWRKLIAAAAFTTRVGDALLLKDASGRITHEVYDKN